MGQETELKFVGPDDALMRVQQSPLLRRWARNRKPQKRVLNAVYFDTQSLALCDAGYVLRVRHEGGGFIQALKGANGADIATRTEVQSKVAALAPKIDAIPDETLRRHIRKITKGSALEPLFCVEVQRSTVLIAPKKGTTIEVAFDRGVIRTNGALRKFDVAISEMELELVRGKAADLAACAKTLTAGVELTLSVQSKSERGHALIADTLDAPVGSRRIELARDATAGEAFRAVIGHCLSHLLGNWSAVTAARDPEGLHQMRVALRRLRSALSLFGEPFRASMRDIEGEVRWIAAVLGRARDLDVFQDEVLRPVAEAHGEDDRLTNLATLVRTRRRVAWAGVLDALESERFRALVLDLAGVTFDRPWLKGTSGAADRLAIELARERLTRRLKRAVKLGRRIGDLSADERHVLRIRLKKLRYAVDFFQALLPGRATRRFLARLGDLQDVLGRLNDAAVARALVDDILAATRASPAAVAMSYAGGVVAGWHLGHARGRAETLKRRWKRLIAVRAPWV